jgi:hypothetical protein
MRFSPIHNKRAIFNVVTALTVSGVGAYTYQRYSIRQAMTDTEEQEVPAMFRGFGLAHFPTTEEYRDHQPQHQSAPV